VISGPRSHRSVFFEVVLLDQKPFLAASRSRPYGTPSLSLSCFCSPPGCPTSRVFFSERHSSPLLCVRPTACPHFAANLSSLACPPFNPVGQDRVSQDTPDRVGRDLLQESWLAGLPVMLVCGACRRFKCGTCLGFFRAPGRVHCGFRQSMPRRGSGCSVV